LLVKKMTCFCLKPVLETVVHGECREVVSCVLQVAIIAFWVVFSVKLLFLPSSLGWRDLKRRRVEWFGCSARRTFVRKADRHDVVYRFSLSFSDNK
jgi:hypothetical protein